MGGSFAATKKGKKGNIAKLPKQPQRGLGVAQLEKIRLQSQMAEYIDPSMQSPFHGNSQKGIHVKLLPSSFMSAMPEAPLFVHRRPNIMMACDCSERAEARYEDCVHWPSTRSSLNQNNITPHQCAQESVTLPLFEQKVQGSENGMRRQQHEWIQIIDLTTPNNEELDLELRL